MNKKRVYIPDNEFDRYPFKQARKRQEEILGICKFCKYYTDTGRGQREKYQCDRYNCCIYDANKCNRTVKARKILTMAIDVQNGGIVREVTEHE